MSTELPKQLWIALWNGYWYRTNIEKGSERYVLGTLHDAEVLALQTKLKELTCPVANALS